MQLSHFVSFGRTILVYPEVLATEGFNPFQPLIRSWFRTSDIKADPGSLKKQTKRQNSQQTSNYQQNWISASLQEFVIRSSARQPRRGSRHFSKGGGG